MTMTTESLIQQLLNRGRTPETARQIREQLQRAIRELDTRIDAAVSTIQVRGGKDYTLSHFIGSEYRKRASLGEIVSIGRMRYSVGQRLGREAWSSARNAGFGKQSVTIGVGRALPGAIDILVDPQTRYSIQNGLLEIVRGDSLIGVFDPAMRVAGGTDGSSSMSSASVAAVLAFYVLQEATKLQRFFVQDLARVAGGAEPMIAVDAAYLTLAEDLSAAVLTFGARIIGAVVCARCGKVRGSDHECETGERPENAPPQVVRKSRIGSAETIIVAPDELRRARAW